MFFLENDKIGLRSLSMFDVENSYYEWLNDTEICRYNSHHVIPMTREKAEKYVESINQSSSDIVLAVITKNEKEHIGNISLQKIDMFSRQAEIAFLFGNKEYSNKGYATMAAFLLIDHAFTAMGLNRLYFGTMVENVRMQRVGEKCFFKKVGCRRQAIYKNGAYHDIFDYDLLVEDWIKCRG